MATQLLPINLERTYTAEEFEALPDDGNHYELIGGKLIMTPPAGGEHGSINRRLIKSIMFFDPEEKLGELWITTGFNMNLGNIPEPDIAFVVADRLPIIDKKAIKVVPDLVVEVWSPSQLTKQGLDKESMEKIRAYQGAGVKIIWSINPDNRTVSVYHPDKADPIEVLGIGQELSGEDVIPNFKIPIAKLFE